MIDKSAIYLRIYFWECLPPWHITSGPPSCGPRGTLKRPLYFLIIAGVVNVILNLISVILLNMDVAGSPWPPPSPSMCPQGWSSLCLTKEDGPLRLNLKAMKLDRHILGQILEIGLPASRALCSLCLTC